jgi:hypothetical protein
MTNPEVLLSTYRHTKYSYTIRNYQWLHVRDNIFDSANWSQMNQ